MAENTSTNQLLRLLFWESTIKCNLSCAHCRRLEDNQAANADLSTSQARDLISQLGELGKGQPFMPILVFSGGEPLCRDDLFELVSHAKTLNIVTALATNGTLVDSDIAKRIKESGISRVSVSLDGATPEVHDKLRQLQGSFDRAVEGIKHLRQNGVPFQINVTLTKNNAHQVEEVYDMASSLGAVAVHIFMLVPVGCGQSLAETDMLTPQQYEDMLVKICQLDARGRIEMKVTCGPHYERVIRQKGLHKARMAGQKKPPSGAKSKSSRGCLAGLGVIFVAHQGNVFPCGYLPVKCGNVLQQSLREIWYESEDLARMRDADALEGKCGLCGYRQICGGCRARAYSVEGNYMAQEPFCAYIPPEIVR
jgi:radical SAM protein with 4Fe4S-binding SPASM domain